MRRRSPNQAAALSRNLDEIPAVTVTSSSDLGLNTFAGNSVTESVGSTGHTYSGLRLLARERRDDVAAASGLDSFRRAGVRGSGVRRDRDRLHTCTKQLAGSASATNFSNSTGIEAGAAAPAIRHLGPLRVVVGTDEVIDVYLENDAKKTVSGATVAGIVGKHARAIVTSKNAFCRVTGGVFLCKVDPIPRGRHADVNVSYLGKKAPEGKATVKVGPAHGTFVSVQPLSASSSARPRGCRGPCTRPRRLDARDRRRFRPSARR